ncbi:hypothetical protein [Phyllobacterium myrsinacearum]|uniref:Uncharacterized protein n=1 Tax=Phyllobacterium myrsinacearum TaxID=28101 RepID=A0A839EZ73_9HYPH|nr:hypothetical protein [Phyllobacterium myrsinacearum]MBA8881760.1 hypothetical protein [Phyllobacterium myrsinacearum]
MSGSVLTFKRTNQAKFNCPIFGVETRVAACMQLRDRVWAGFKPPVRKGCQACMSAGKCPMAKLVDKMIYGKHDKNAPEPYASTEPKTVRLRDDLLERVLPIIVRDGTMNNFGVPAKERALIETANERIRKQMQHAPSAISDTSVTRRRTTLKPSPASEPANDDLIDAASSGDMAAALNA